MCQRNKVLVAAAVECFQHDTARMQTVGYSQASLHLPVAGGTGPGTFLQVMACHLMLLILRKIHVYLRGSNSSECMIHCHC
jgi:hypothetical protein